ncbi:helix-turn-helix transcriptional regulator [Hydrogenophaga sp. OTU3427]|uniref:helix-turn-helix transcriptional regulator n=1 Tax=Hydrogenophaga sp. OTU3427 TaxID=3043856 RepID=UPI00406CF043
MNEVESLTGLKKSHVYGLIRLGSFPQRVVLSRRCVAFLEHEVLAWLDARVAERGQA